MSWLLVVLIPALLMGAAVGLERLETGLSATAERAAPQANLVVSGN